MRHMVPQQLRVCTAVISMELKKVEAKVKALEAEDKHLKLQPLPEPSPTAHSKEPKAAAAVAARSSSAHPSRWPSPWLASTGYNWVHALMFDVYVCCTAVCMCVVVC